MSEARAEPRLDDATIDRIAERVARRLRAKPCELRRRDHAAPPVSCRLPWSDIHRIRAHARRRGMTVSKWAASVLRAALTAEEAVYPPVDARSLLALNGRPSRDPNPPHRPEPPDRRPPRARVSAIINGWLARLAAPCRPCRAMCLRFFKAALERRRRKVLFPMTSQPNSALVNALFRRTERRRNFKKALGRG